MIEEIAREYAYMAGFVDGEGHIGIKKYIRNDFQSPTYSERVSVGGICEYAIKSFNNMFPGYIYHHKPNKKSPHGFWSWEVTDDKAKHFLREILPFLRIKELEARMVLALSNNKEKNKRRPISPKDLHIRETLYKTIKALHKGDRYE